MHDSHSEAHYPSNPWHSRRFTDGFIERNIEELVKHRHASLAPYLHSTRRVWRENLTRSVNKATNRSVRNCYFVLEKSNGAEQK